MNEEWRDIVGFVGLYQVSNLGNVKSFINFPKGRFLKLTPRSRKRENEYLCVGLNNQLFSVHRLVAEAFVPKINGKNLVNHKDGNKKNNIISNLEWCSSKENNLHAFRTGLNKHRIQDFVVKKLTLAQKKDICNNLSLNTRQWAKKLKVPTSLISKIRKQNGIYSRKTFTQEQIIFIKSNPKLSSNFLAKKIGFVTSSVSRLRKKLFNNQQKFI